MIDHVVIVGAGFSGALQAINLVRHDGPRATLIDRQADAGTGLAYGTAHPAHLLNVRASNMSAFPDDPDHFVRWLSGRSIGDLAPRFVPRLTYGAYLRELLDRAARESPGRLAILRGEVADITYDGCAHVSLEDGRRIDADAAVLAVGNLPPHPPPGFDAESLGPGRYAANCWDPAATEGLGRKDYVLILGTGLTMVDLALLLDEKGFEGRIVAMSRRGLAPRAHAAPGPPSAPIRTRPATIASTLVRNVRTRGEVVGWRAAVDELRPFTQDMWRSASNPERSRFVRHLRPWWDVHRHRLAPEVADRIAAMQQRGQLRIIAGKTGSVEECDDRAAVAWRPRGETEWQQLDAQRIINCTGPQGDLLRAGEPVLRHLVDRGSIRPDDGRLGIDVDSQLRTIAADGTANDWLYALGPMTRGAFWEIVAVPDIRAHAWTLARRLSNAHWVAEGL
jgi:uncharacterized NAD(P)/FAD-binding protein YdhS